MGKFFQNDGKGKRRFKIERTESMILGWRAKLHLAMYYNKFFKSFPDTDLKLLEVEQSQGVQAQN